MRADRKKLQLSMARACMTVADLVLAAGMPEQTVKNVLAGRSIRPATLGRVAKALNVDPADLIEEVM